MRKFYVSMQFHCRRATLLTFKVVLISILALSLSNQALADYTIPAGTTVDANSITGQSGVLIINGTLRVSNDASLPGFTSVIMNGPGPNGQIYWTNNSDLSFSEGTSFDIINGGIGLNSDASNGSQRLWVGSTLIATSNGKAGAVYSFKDFNATGGLPFSLVSPSPICYTTAFTATLTPLNTNVHYKCTWSVNNGASISPATVPDFTTAQTATITTNSNVAKTYTITCNIFKLVGKNSILILTKTIDVTINPASAGKWLGVNTNWNDPVNWCPGVPTETLDVTIPLLGAQSFYPVVSGTASVRNIIIIPGASLTINNPGTLQIAGTISGIINATNGTLEFNGSTTQTLSGSTLKNRTIKNLVVSNAAGLNVSGTSNDTLNITGALTFGSAAAKLNSGNNITLKSTAAGTANVGKVGTGNTITGQFVVERFINSWENPGAGQHGKAWQLVATPTDGQTVKESWMENGSLAPTNYGTQITGSGTGFDLTTAAPSLKYYDYATNNYKGVTNTNDRVYRPGGYMLFVRGDRGIAFPNVGNTTLRTKGNLITGPTTSISVHKNSYESVGNPYASAIDLRKITTTGIDEFFYVWDPALTSGSASQYGLGGFQSLYFSDGNYYATPGGGSYGPADNPVPNNFIQSGQAFFVQATNTDGTISFTEDAKASGSKLLMRTMGATNKVSQLRTNLYGVNPDGSNFLSDGALLQYGDNYSNAIDGMDARKVANTSENLSIKSGGKMLAIERRQTIDGADTVVLNLTTVRVQSYRYEFAAKNLSSPGLEGWVEDTYLKTRTPLNLEGTTTVDFKIENIAGSYAANRFRIVFTEAVASILPVTFVSVKATQKDADIVVEWKVENESNLKQYEIERSLDGNTFSKVGTVVAGSKGAGVYNWLDQQPTSGYNYYRIRSVDIDGKTSLTRIVKVMVEKAASAIKVYPNPAVNATVNLRLTNQPAGVYYVRLLNPLGQVIISKQILHTEGSSIEIIKWSRQSARGNYQLQISKPDGNSEAFTILF